MSRSTNPMLFKTGTEPLPSSPRSHRLDESAAGYSLTGCSPALPVSASPTGLYRQAEDVHLSSNSNGTGDSPLDFGAAAGQTINYQGGPNQMIEVGQAGRSNSARKMSQVPRQQKLQQTWLSPVRSAHLTGQVWHSKRTDRPVSGQPSRTAPGGERAA